MILFAGYTEIRPGELYALRREDIQGQFASISRSFSSCSYEITPPKNGKTRTITIPPVAEDALLSVPEHVSGLMFETPTGKPWKAGLHNRFWTRLRLLANRPGMDFCCLRHCAATMLLERGSTPWDVAIQLGHTDGGQLVSEVYGHPREDAARARLLAVWGDDVAPLACPRH